MIIDGKLLAQKKETQIRKTCQELLSKKIIPWCVTFVACEDPEGNFYTKTKTKVCERVGVKLTKKTFSFKQDSEKIQTEIIAEAAQPDVHGIMIQKPSQAVIKGIFKKKNFNKYWSSITNCIPPQKDIDCLSALSLGNIMQGNYQFLPATVAAIWDIINFSKTDVCGKTIAILGFSEIIGKPLSITLRDQGATVILLGSRSQNLAEFTKKSDIIISCVGKPKLITQSMVMPGSVIIDAATKKIGEKIYGDVDFNNLIGIARAITPVPGGVGPLTVINLVNNIIQASQR